MSELCKVCGAAVGTPEERREQGLHPGMPTVCSGCGDIAVLDDALELKALDAEELEALMTEYPIVGLVRNDLLSEKVTDGSTCPGCGGGLNIGIGKDPRPEIRPHNPGFCPACHAIVLITFDMRLRLATDEERAQLLQSPNLPHAVRAALLADTGEATKETHCPVCFRKLSRVSSMGYQDVEAMPTEGDFSICDWCASLLAFTNDEGDVRAATDEEVAQVLTDHPEVQAFMNQVLAAASRGNQA